MKKTTDFIEKMQQIKIYILNGKISLLTLIAMLIFIFIPGTQKQYQKS